MGDDAILGRQGEPAGADLQRVDLQARVVVFEPEDRREDVAAIGDAAREKPRAGRDTAVIPRAELVVADCGNRVAGNQLRGGANEPAVLSSLIKPAANIPI
jgi:hypothetical protein